ncbi:MAG: hypothetical protein ACRD9R_08170 [Pyrinomonadaceae bacterium]
MKRAGVFALALLACLCVDPPTVSRAQEKLVSARAGLVTLVEGEVLRRPGGGKEVEPLKKGVTLADGDVVLTTGKGHADWSLTPDSYLHVGAGAFVRAYGTGFGAMHFDVERGEILVVVRSLKGGASLVIHTPPGQLTVHKAGRYLFRVAENGETEAAVAKGELRYRDERGKEFSLKKRMKVNFYRAGKKVTHGT